MNIQAGAVVRLTRLCYNNSSKSIGICFYSYNVKGYSLKDPYCMVIFENGSFGPFSIHEQQEFFQEVGKTNLLRPYTDRDTGLVCQDYQRGIFNPVFIQYSKMFEQAQRLKIVGERRMA